MSQTMTRDDARRIRDETSEAREQASKRRDEAWSEMNRVARCVAECLISGGEEAAQEFATEYAAAKDTYAESVADWKAAREAWLRAREDWLHATA